MLFTILQRSASLAAGLVPEVAANNKGDMNAREWVFTISKISKDSDEPLIDAIERITRSNPRLKENKFYAKIVQQNSTEDAIQTQSPGSNPNIYLADYLESTQGPGRAKLGQILSHAVEEPLKEFCRLFSDTQTGIKAKLKANAKLHERVLMLDTVKQDAREAWFSLSSVSGAQMITSVSGCHLATSVAYGDWGPTSLAPRHWPHYCDTFAHLVVTGKLPKLEKLDLTSLRIDLPAMEKLAFAFASGSLPNLTELYLGFNQIGDKGLEALSGALAMGSLPNLTKLNLGFNQIGDEGLEALSGAIAMGSLQQLRVLWLDNNQIGDGGLQAFASAVASGSLASLEKIVVDDRYKRHPQLMALRRARGIQIV
jgi:Leucine-rich repeat (LRR) protein